MELGSARGRRRSIDPTVLIAVGGGVLTLILLVVVIGLVISRKGNRGPGPNGAIEIAQAGPAGDEAAGNDEGTLKPKPIDALPDAPKSPVSASDTASQFEGPKPIASVPARNAQAEGAESWGGGESKIIVGRRDELTFGPPGCKAVVVGNKVWDIAKKQPLSSLEDPFDEWGLTSLSPNGRWFAATDGWHSRKNVKVGVWNTETGKQHLPVPGDPERSVELLAVSNEELILCRPESKTVHRWNVETGEQQEPHVLDVRTIDSDEMALTSDGQYLAIAVDDRMIVLKLDTGQVAAVMGAPEFMERDPPGLAALMLNGPGISDHRAEEHEADSIYTWLQSVAFSADSQELAAISVHPLRLICWDSGGKLVFDEPFYPPGGMFSTRQLLAFPDHSAWLIEGHVLDRESGMIVLHIAAENADDLRAQVYDNDHLVGTFPHNPSELSTIKIPWKEIRASLAVMKEDGPAVLRPSKPVGIRIDLGSLRGDRTQTANLIGSALTKRLALRDIPVERDAPNYFQLRFTERAGEQLKVVQREFGIFGRDRDTGRTITDAQGTLVLELIAAGQEKPVWGHTVTSRTLGQFDGAMNDANARKSMLEFLARQIGDMEIPYFIPESDDLPALPLVID